MDYIRDLIKYENESSILDFKKVQYTSKNYKELIKDIMAMANVPRDSKRYIIIGVKDKPGEDKTYHSIEKNEFIDEANYQQIIRDNIEPAIDFRYFPYEMDGILFGVFEIEVTKNPPYMMRKDYDSMQRGDTFIRRGSQTGKLTRGDLDNLLAYRKKYQFNNKVKVGFGEKLQSKYTPNIENLKKLSEESEQLKSMEGDDFSYFLTEKLSEKINISIQNTANKYLEDCSFEIKIPSKDILIPLEYPEEPRKTNVYHFSNPIHRDFYSIQNYPDVIQKDGYYFVKSDIESIKHQMTTDVFKVELRVFFKPRCMGTTIECPFRLLAKNLEAPIEGVLEFNCRYDELSE